MSCQTSNCGCSPSAYPITNNECCTDVAEYTRLAYSSAQSAYANAQNAEESAQQAAAILADAVLKSGSTMTGQLVLFGNPTTALGAAPKQYVDSSLASGLALKLSISGDTMTGFLTLNASPTSNLHATTKLYTDTADNLRVLKTGDTMTGNLKVNGEIASSSSFNGIGYTIGAGATITQQNSKTDSVTIDNVCGEITCYSAAPDWNFRVNNNTVNETDVIIVSVQKKISGTGTLFAYVDSVGSGYFDLMVTTFGTPANSQPVINFAVIRSQPV